MSQEKGVGSFMSLSVSLLQYFLRPTVKLYGLMELEEKHLFSNVASFFYFNLMYKRNKTFLKEKSIKKAKRKQARSFFHSQ